MGSPPAGRPGLTGSRSTAVTITLAWVAEITPPANAVPVAARSPLTALANARVARPVPLRPPAIAVQKSAVDDQPSARAALVASISATTFSSTASRVDRSRSRPVAVSSSSTGVRAAHNTSPSPATSSRAAATTPAGVTGGAVGVVVLDMTPLSQRPPTQPTPRTPYPQGKIPERTHLG